MAINGKCGIFRMETNFIVYIFHGESFVTEVDSACQNNRYWKIIIISYSFVHFCSISLSPYPMCGPANFHLVLLPARSSAACLNQGVTVNYDILSRDR